MDEELLVWFEGRLVGRLRRVDDTRIGFRYDESWVSDWRQGRAHAISIALPVHPDAEMDASAFIAGLLPDSVKHRELLAGEMDMGEDTSNFAFIKRIGRDSAGALTIIATDEDLETAGPRVQWLDDGELEEHLKSLPRRPLLIDEEGGIVLSLAGVNDKAAVVVSKGRIGLPKNGQASTHIIKVDIPGLDDSIKTEHFCLRLAKAVGFRVPMTQMHRVGEEEFMLMHRYDRTVRDKKLIRLHQEDFCQALNVMPGKKYQRHGGPGWAESFNLMSRTVNPTASRAILSKMAVFQFLSGNPDAHAKNYSLVYRGESGVLDLAPIYDLNNAAAFKTYFKDVRPIMAMHIGDKKWRDEVTWEDWGAFARDCDLSEKMVFETITQMAGDILEVIQDVKAEVSVQCPDCKAINIAVSDIEDRCHEWLGHKPECTHEPDPGLDLGPSF
jgi:serine/threonine-protein kinase HipA